MRNILFLSTLPLILILSACGSSGTSQTEDVTEIDVVDITSDGAPIVPQEDNQATFVPGEQPQSARSSSTSLGYTPTGNTMEFLAHTEEILDINDILVCIDKYHNQRCKRASNSDGHRTLFYNKSREVSTVNFKTRIILGTDTLPTSVEDGYVSNRSVDGSDDIISLIAEAYDGVDSELFNTISITYKFKADNVDVTSFDQISQKCFPRSSFATNNFIGSSTRGGPDNFVGGNGGLPVILHMNGAGGHTTYTSALDLTSSTLEFRFSPQINCIESSTKSEVSYTVDATEDIEVEVLVDLGDVTFAPYRIAVENNAGHEVGNKDIEFVRSFAEDSKTLEISTEICTEDLCVGPFTQASQTLDAFEQGVKDGLLGTITVTSENTGGYKSSSGYYGRTAVKFSEADSSLNWIQYKCGKYKMEFGNVNATLTRTQGDTFYYKLSYDAEPRNIAHERVCGDHEVGRNRGNLGYKNLGFRDSPTFQLQKKSNRNKHYLFYKGDQSRVQRMATGINGRFFEAPKFRNRVCMGDYRFDGGLYVINPDVEPYCEYQRFDSDDLFSASQYYEANPNAANGLGKRETHLLSLTNYSASNIVKTADSSGIAVFTVTNQLSGLIFELENKFNSIERNDLNVTLRSIDRVYDEEDGIYNITLNIAFKEKDSGDEGDGLDKPKFDALHVHRTIVNFKDAYGKETSQTLELPRGTDFSTLSNLYIGCITYEVDEVNVANGIQILKNPGLIIMRVVQEDQILRSLVLVAVL